jgi:hypothetical protein
VKHPAVFDDQRAVVEDEGRQGSQPLGGAPRRRKAAASDEDDADALAARRIDRRARAGRYRLVTAEQRPVEVEGEQLELQRPSQISIFSITSPGRIRSTTSMPAATVPSSV